MWFDIDVDGVRIQMQVKGYEKSNKQNWDDLWCTCDFAFSSGSWLNYHKESDETLLSCEIEQLAKALSELLDNKLTDIKEIECLEPDFRFKLYPQIDLKGRQGYSPDFDIQDVYLEWRVYFWCEGGITDNHLTVILDRDEIEKLKDYLLNVMK